ncbi:hypothetical protein [Allosphingosinicella deserti]|uniref:Uncharacterized protein n=1 Tax=Allosphingosinicella deserti TaxID=2116704 RepID=A0A2P7QR77_9SPHN|nr:hypothetical protein [Sphingomonas deserti]PSJ40473.1 hypothetical protein C7I55_09045 [Sphingomonas deserti]
MVFSIGCGIFALFSLAGTLERPPVKGPTIYKGSIQLFWAAQILFFVAGLAGLVTVLVESRPVTGVYPRVTPDASHDNDQPLFLSA